MKFIYRKYQRVLSLSDFWDTHPARSQEETLRIKLEEERFRREVYKNGIYIYLYMIYICIHLC